MRHAFKTNDSSPLSSDLSGHGGGFGDGLVVR